MSSGQVFVLCIILIACGFSFARHYLSSRAAQPREDPQVDARIKALEERVKTLERIVTDKDYDLKRQFDRL
ncbi:MAG TPA: hypothetical protein VF271_06785 [Rhodanobacteraceae bacterium]